MRRAFIGGGTMGEAITAGVLDKGVVAPADIAACDISPARRDHLAKTSGVSVGEEANAVSSESEIVMLAIKPQELPAAGRTLNSTLNGIPTVTSTMVRAT